MDNGKSNDVKLSVVPDLKGAFELVCHRFYIPIAIPVPDTNALAAKGAMRLQATISNVHCIKEKCTLWNADAGECWDVSAAKGQALLAQLTLEKETFGRVGPQGGN